VGKLALKDFVAYLDKAGVETVETVGRSHKEGNDGNDGNDSNDSNKEGNRGVAWTTQLGSRPDAAWHTTYTGRTYLQPQLNKAMRKEECQYKGDRNLKDYLLFDKQRWHCHRPERDNTGNKEYVEGVMLPTAQWPSDHGAVSCVLDRFVMEEEGGEL
jgi:hypothetical protein